MQISFETLQAALQHLPYFPCLVSLCNKKNAYLVGGVVRDALTGFPVMDVDLVFPEDPTLLAKEFARQIGGNWFWLDESRQQSRVVLNSSKLCPDFDFAPFRAPTLGQDLLDRDFTVNSMALPLVGHCSSDLLVDPLCGLDDLEKGVLRMSSKSSFADDPLRILKGIRHATVLDLLVEEETLVCMQQQVTGLYRVAVERIRQEVWKIIASKNAARGLDLLSQTMAGNYLFGNSYSGHLCILKTVLSDNRSRLSKLAEIQPVVEGWLTEEVEQGLSNETLLIWISLLVQLESNLPQRLAQEWMLCRKARVNVENLAGRADELWTEFASIGQTGRSFSLWSRKRLVDPKLLLLTLFMRRELSLSQLADIARWAQIVETLEEEDLAPIVNGYWLQSELGLQEGPEMKKAFELIAEAEISGEVLNQEDVRNLLVARYKNSD